MAPLPSHPAGPAAGRSAWRLCVVVTLLAALLPAVLWPGDTPWTNDEPLLIASALRANQAHRPAYVGLAGNLQIHYGPLPTQIYQAILLSTHNPLLLVAIRAALCSGVTALSLLWLARTLRFNPWFAAAIVLAPNVYLFNRILWDATFVVPVGSLALAAFASFLHAGSRRALLTTLACAAALPLIHPQTLPLPLAIGGYLLWRHRPALRRHKLAIAGVALVLLALNAAYFAYVGWAVLHLGRYAGSGYGGGRAPPPRAALTALRGGEILWTDPLSAGIDRIGPMAGAVRAAMTVSQGVEWLVWAGMGIAAWCAWRSLREPGLSAEPRRRVLHVALAALLMQIGLYAVIGVPPMVSYYFGPFPLTVLFAWVAIQSLDRLVLKLRGNRQSFYEYRHPEPEASPPSEGSLPWRGKKRSFAALRMTEAKPPLEAGASMAEAGASVAEPGEVIAGPGDVIAGPGASGAKADDPVRLEAPSAMRLGGAVVLLYALCMLITTGAGVWQIHRLGWPRGSTSPNLSNQVAVVRALNQYADTSVLTNVQIYEDYPHALRTLRQLLLTEDHPAPRPHAGRLFIRYRTDASPLDGRIELVGLPEGDIPAGAKLIPLEPPASPPPPASPASPPGSTRPTGSSRPPS